MSGSPFGARRRVVRPSPVFLLIVAIAVVGAVLAWDTDPLSTRARAGVFILVVAGWIVSVCLHEFAHAYLSWRAGDREVQMRGYLTLNPIRYSHPLLSIGLPIVFIALGGFALPGGAVYVNSGYFPAGTRRAISAAGPAVNAVCAIVLLVIIRLYGSPHTHGAFWMGLSFLAFLQITATILNLLPFPGTDGYGIVEPSLSYQTRRALDQFKPYGLLLLLAVLWVPQLNRLFFEAVYWVFELSGISSDWAAVGSQLTRFWT
ncbi:MAG: site-2 protease family protein [Nocardia sp.]|nr:site-2 protease family protein [Nocardia sp.]